ncbi:hypothetical protein ACFL7E_08980, partial [Thermodesulfobacteriota bacterium]
TPIGVHGWDLSDSGDSAVNNITVNSDGEMYGWWVRNRNNPPGVFIYKLVRIDESTGIATEVGEGESGVSGFGANGLDFDKPDNPFDAETLYLVNTGGFIYTIDTGSGAATYAGTIATFVAHHGDFDPSSNLYYGISNYGGAARDLVVADLSTFSIISELDDLDDNIHVITFVFVDEGGTNQPPVAVCQNVSIPANETCEACASVDNGSYDPDGDELNYEQVPDCDYTLGTTEVTLTSIYGFSLPHL